MGNIQPQASIEHEYCEHNHQQRYIRFLLVDSDLAERNIPYPETGNWQNNGNNKCGDQEPEQMTLEELRYRKKIQFMFCLNLFRFSSEEFNL